MLFLLTEDGSSSVQQVLEPVSAGRGIISEECEKSFEGESLSHPPMGVALSGSQHGLAEQFLLSSFPLPHLLRGFRYWLMLPTSDRPLAMLLAQQESFEPPEGDCFRDLLEHFCPSREERTRGPQQDSRPRSRRARQIQPSAARLAPYCSRTEY